MTVTESVTEGKVRRLIRAKRASSQDNCEHSTDFGLFSADFDPGRVVAGRRAVANSAVAAGLASGKIQTLPTHSTGHLKK